MRISDWSSDVCSSDFLDTLLERPDLGLQRLGLGVGSGRVDGIFAAAMIAPHAIFRADDAADRHDQDDADDHFKGVHGRNPFACFLSLFQFSGASRSFSISSYNTSPRSSEERRVGKACVSTFSYRWSP